jgi:hypothetical protein
MSILIYKLIDWFFILTINIFIYENISTHKLIVGDTKMLCYMLPGTTSEEIDDARLNDPNLKEGNERFYIYPQGLYSGLMLSKQDLKFDKPDNIGEGTYQYEWLLTYTAILNELLIDLGMVCTCKKMIATSNWEFRCMAHPGKNGFECCAVDYCLHYLDTFQCLLGNPSFYPDRTDIQGRSVQAFPQMFKRIHRMIAHIYHNHKDLFKKYEEKYRLNERFLLFCKKYNLINKKDIYIK